MRVAILISGKGTNANALLSAMADDSFPATAALLLSNKPNAEGLALGSTYGVPTEVVDHKDFDDRDSFEEKLHETLKDNDVELVCLAGFMRLLNPSFVNRWRDRMINIHPSLLPSYKGLDTHERALEDGVKITGCTVHFVRPEMDSGPIIGQAAVPVLGDDTPETLAQRIQAAEHVLFPNCLKLVAEKRVRIKDKVALVDGSEPVVQTLYSPSA